ARGGSYLGVAPTTPRTSERTKCTLCHVRAVAWAWHKSSAGILCTSRARASTPAAPQEPGRHGLRHRQVGDKRCDQDRPVERRERRDPDARFSTAAPG